MTDFDGTLWKSTAQTMPGGATPTIAIVASGSSGSTGSGRTAFFPVGKIYATNGVPLAPFSGILTLAPP